MAHKEGAPKPSEALRGFNPDELPYRAQNIPRPMF